MYPNCRHLLRKVRHHIYPYHRNVLQSNSEWCGNSRNVGNTVAYSFPAVWLRHNLAKTQPSKKWHKHPKTWWVLLANLLETPSDRPQPIQETSIRATSDTSDTSDTRTANPHKNEQTGVVRHLTHPMMLDTVFQKLNVKMINGRGFFGIGWLVMQFLHSLTWVCCLVCVWQVSTKALVHCFFLLWSAIDDVG